jgi:hypothetical protein
MPPASSSSSASSSASSDACSSSPSPPLPGRPASIFVCFDARHDADLGARFANQCRAAGSPLAVVDASREEEPHDGWEEGLRRRLRRVHAVVVLCGEHTDSASNVAREFGIAQEQSIPYVLLWGRRATPCTRPLMARSSDHFYTWIWDIVVAQIEDAMRSDPGAPEAPDLGGVRGGRKG